MQDTMTSQHSDSSSLLQPGHLRIIKRDGSLASFDENNITVAMTKAFLAVEGDHAQHSSRIRDEVHKFTKQVSDRFHHKFPEGGIIHIEDIQDQVELALMRAQEHKVARAYVLYREEQRKKREAMAHLQTLSPEIQVTLKNGQKTLLNKMRLTTVVQEACEQLEGVDAKQIIHETLRNLYDGVPIDEVTKAAIMTARTWIEREPNYTFVAARLLLDSLRQEALSFLDIAQGATAHEMEKMYPLYFERYIQKGIELKRLAPMMADYDLKKLGSALVASRDFKFTYLGLQTLHDRYFLHSEKTRFEMPQAFFMRVAMGLASLEKPEEKEKWAIEFYHLLSTFVFMSSTPTLFNSGTLHPQLSSCYLSTIPQDSLEDICDAIKYNCLLSKYAGGLGNDWSYIRGMGSHIRGTNGESLGVIPFMKMAATALDAVNQGGKRKGAGCAYLETWHIDIEEFLDLRKNTGDERRRTPDMNTANWIPDLFMIRLHEKGEWTLFSPDETPDLHDTYGDEFAKIYVDYEQKAKEGKIKNFRKIPAEKLWRKMLSMLYETGHPWMTFKDVCNLRSPQQHAGVVHSSNLCTEITLNTSADEIAVCNLGSINLPEHMADGKLNQEKLKNTIRVAIRMLDNVIDYNFYPVEHAKTSNLRHRPIGLGLMGFQDALYQLRIPYASSQAIEFADESMEMMSYYALESSMELAKERGTYQSYPGSLWSQGILPIDSIQKVKKARSAFSSNYFNQDTSQHLDWNHLREHIQQHGMRNSNVMAIAPTATISNICGVTQSIEPTYQNLFVKSNLSGEFTVVNPYLVADLKAAELWDEVMANDLKYFDGSVQKIERIPQELKELYATAFELNPFYLIDAASRRQKWIDQAQSLNLYMLQPSGKKLDELYRHAWLMGLKTTYYLRTMGATHTEKSTITDHNLNAVQVVSQKVCSIDNPDCESCQ